MMIGLLLVLLLFFVIPLLIIEAYKKNARGNPFMVESSCMGKILIGLFSLISFFASIFAIFYFIGLGLKVGLGW